MTLRKPMPILLVEDDKTDVACVQRAFVRNGIESPLHIASNGRDALALLRCDDPHNSDRPALRPCIILLDIGMPVMNGIEFLREIKADARLRAIPVVMLTTSQEESDRLESFQLGVAGYIVKTLDFDEFAEAVQIVHSYWALNDLP